MYIKNIFKKRKLYIFFPIFLTKPFLQKNLSTLPKIPIFKRLIEHNKKSISIEFKQYQESFSYSDLIYYISTLKLSLQAIKKVKDLEQKTIGIFIEPGFSYAVAIFGIWASGGIAVPICMLHFFK